MKNELDESMLAKVAHLYYEKLLTQEAIARRLSMTRWKVGRILQAARETGVVSISINHGNKRVPDLEEALIAKYSVEEAIVVATKESRDQDGIKAVAVAASELLVALTSIPSVLGVSWGRTLNAVADSIKPGWTEGIHIVQLNGALSLSSADGSQLDPAQKLACAGRGRYTLMPVPAIVDDPRVKSGLERDSTVKQILSIARATPAALFSLGSLSTESVLVQSGYLSRGEVQKLQDSGAMGDILGRFVSSTGEIVDHELDARTLGISIQDLKAKKLRIAVAHGSQKTEITRAALFAQVPTHLVVDETIAKGLVQQP